MDIDILIEERRGVGISKIVNSHGWEYFRALERRVIEEIAGQDHLVIAPGGGAVLDPENVRSLKKKGLILWLKAEPETLAKRLDGDLQTISSRPTLTGRGTLGEIREVKSSRSPLYDKAADAEVDTTDLGVEAVVEKILSIFPPTQPSPLRGGG